MLLRTHQTHHAATRPHRRVARLSLAALALASLTAGCDTSSAPRPTANAPRPTDALTPGEAAKPEAAPVPGAGRAPTFHPTTGPAPDPASTAKKPPTAKDLARYTRGIPGRGALHASIHTTMGTIRCALYEDHAPVAVANFVGLARGLKAWTHPKTRKPQVGKPLYDGLIFHRMIPRFVIQSGDPLGVGVGGPGYQIPDEHHPSRTYDRGGLLSMANAGPNTGGSQFFITEQPAPHLNGKFTIFGACEELDTVRKIARVPRNQQPGARRDRPTPSVTIETITFARK